MLNLIASNRGTTEERTVDEKLQEVRYLEKFAKAIYNQKDREKEDDSEVFFQRKFLIFQNHNFNESMRWKN